MVKLNLPRALPLPPARVLCLPRALRLPRARVLRLPRVRLWPSLGLGAVVATGDASSTNECPRMALGTMLDQMAVVGPKHEKAKKAEKSDDEDSDSESDSEGDGKKKKAKE